MTSVAEAANGIKRKRSKVQVMYVIHTALYAVALVLCMLNQYSVGVVLGVANMVGYFACLRGQLKHYSDMVAEADIQYGMCSNMQDVQYCGNNVFSSQEFSRLKILPLDESENSFMGRYGVRASYKKMNVTISEVTFHYRCMENGKSKTYKFLNGTLVKGENISWENQEEWLILCKGMIDETTKEAFCRSCGYHPADLEKSSLTERFEVYAMKPEMELPVLLEQRILKLTKKHMSVAAIRLQTNAVIIFLGNRFYTRRTKVRILPTERELQTNPFIERDAVLNFMESWIVK